MIIAILHNSHNVIFHTLFSEIQVRKREGMDNVRMQNCVGEGVTSTAAMPLLPVVPISMSIALFW